MRNVRPCKYSRSLGGHNTIFSKIPSFLEIQDVPTSKYLSFGSMFTKAVKNKSDVMPLGKEAVS